MVDASQGGAEKSRIIDLDVDIGADAVDYKYASFATHKVFVFSDI